MNLSLDGMPWFPLNLDRKSSIILQPPQPVSSGNAVSGGIPGAHGVNNSGYGHAENANSGHGSLKSIPFILNL
ncbi:hypothetical protein OIU78_023619 [Salix suchowensis]|nr:hypothetical protein OIU78_023619 [Salix suchowensis]